MRAATTNLINTLKESNAVRSKLRLIAEWEQNRYSPLSIAVTGNPDPTNDAYLIYNLDSVALPSRPATGIAKARLGSTALRAEKQYRDFPTDSRFYTGSPNSYYTYWASTNKSGTSKGTDDGYALSTPVTITVTYTNPVWANKLVAGFETSYASPKTYQVQVSTNGTTWTTVVNSSLLDSKGQVTRYSNASNWQEAADYVNPKQYKAIRLTVTSMDKPSSNVDVLQLGLRLESDLSDFVINYNKTFEVSDHSFIAPFGRASSNQGTINLSNVDSRFNNDNDASIYKGLIDRHVKFMLDVGIDVGNSNYEYVRELTMYADVWNGEGKSEKSVTLKDSSIRLQEIKLPPVYYENQTIGAIIWRLCDLAGFTNYAYIQRNDDSAFTVPHFYNNPEQSVWEIMSLIAEGTQTAVYFDEYDVLQIKTRKSAFDQSKAVAWNFDAIRNGSKLPDIVDVTEDTTLEANQVDVKYTARSFSDFNNGFAKMEVAWEPEEEVVTLRSSSLTANLSTNSEWITIRAQDAKLWPYTSKININGELLSYEGKEYFYYTNATNVVKVVVNSLEQKNKIDSELSDDKYAWKNDFTGRFKVKARGLYGTPVKNTYVKQFPNYSAPIINYYVGLRSSHPTGLIRDLEQGLMRIQPPTNILDQDYIVALNEIPVTGNQVRYGTRLRFPEGVVGRQSIGLYFAGWESGSGYYLELGPTQQVADVENRQWRNEAVLYGMQEGKQLDFYPGQNKGPYIDFQKDKWYDIEIKYNHSDTYDQINLFVDGVYKFDWSIARAAMPWTYNRGYFGVLTRGYSVGEFEYVYAISDQDEILAPDQSTFFDMVNGGYTSGAIADYNYKLTSEYRTFYGRLATGNYSTKPLVNRSVIDEFGPVVHEVRDYEVKFNNSPVLHSFLNITNTQAVCVDYTADPYGAKFTLANVSRINAVIKGEDSLTFGPDNTVNHSFFVYGRVLESADEQSMVSTDDQSVRTRGLVKLDVSHEFIQTKEAAQNLSDWIVSHWADGGEEVSVEVFGNCLVQLGDVVTLNYPIKGYYPVTHKYFIVSYTSSYEAGLKTTLNLRRVRI